MKASILALISEIEDGKDPREFWELCAALLANFPGCDPLYDQIPPALQPYSYLTFRQANFLARLLTTPAYEYEFRAIAEALRRRLCGA